MAAQTMNNPLTSGRGACSVTNIYVVPQYCTPVTVKYSAAIAVSRQSRWNRRRIELCVKKLEWDK